MRGLLAIAIWLLAASLAFAQSTVLQVGPWTPGHVPIYSQTYNGQPYVLDGGGSAGGPLFTNLSELGVTSVSPTGTYPSANSGNGPRAEHACLFDAPSTNPTGYHYICFDPNAGGGGLIDYGAANGATQLPLTITVNGVSYPFPGTNSGNVSGPGSTAVNNIPLWNNTNGTLVKDSGIAIQSPFVYGAKCDGSTVDTTAFNAAQAAGSRIELPAFVICKIADFTLTSNQTLDCHGSQLIAAPGAHWLVKKTGSNVTVRNCVLTDASGYTLVSTTLNQNAAPGATTLYLTNSTNFQPGQMVSVLLNSGSYWTTKVVAVGAGYITIPSPGIPYSISGTPTVASGGSGWPALAEVVVNGGKPTADGVPATGHIGASGGAVNAFVLDTPGFWFADPGSTLGIYTPGTTQAIAATISVTVSGANSGNVVDAAFGVYTIDNACCGETQNIQITQAPVGMQIANTSANPGYTTAETIRGLTFSNISLVGLAKMCNVNNTFVREAQVIGGLHRASNFGALGFYDDANNCTIASGGNTFDVLALDFEMGGVANSAGGGGVDHFISAVFDGNRNLGFGCFGCFNLDATYLDATFSGPNAQNGSGGAGVGVAFTGTAVNNTITKLTTHDNATDLHFGNETSGVWLGSETWSWSKIQSGFGDSLYPGNLLFSIPASSTVSGSSPVYFTPTSNSTTEVTGILNGFSGEMTTFEVFGSVAPGSVTLTAAFRLARAGLGTVTVGSCSWTGSATSCLYSGPGVKIQPGDQFDLAVVPSGGSFPAGETIAAFANRM